MPLFVDLRKEEENESEGGMGRVEEDEEGGGRGRDYALHLGSQSIETLILACQCIFCDKFVTAWLGRVPERSN